MSPSAPAAFIAASSLCYGEGDCKKAQSAPARAQFSVPGAMRCVISATALAVTFLDLSSQSPMTEPTQTSDDTSISGASAGGPPDALALVVAWSPAEPGRLGEVCIIPPARPGTAFLLGRGAPGAADPHPRLDFVRNRAGIVEPRPPLRSPKISRVQLSAEPHGVESLVVRNVGRCPLLHNGAPVDSVTVVPRDTLQLGNELLLLCVRRRAWVHSVCGRPPPMPFGDADPHGIVGESPAAWDLRRQIAFVAPRSDHVLIAGESGTGKELAARALHALSPRAQAGFVARNAATFPVGLVDAELFGHAKNYPNAGMIERHGLVGEAAGATLFLDEIAELPQALQTHLLRVLDNGEYQRLGESIMRVSDFRLIAATNHPAELRHDLVARLKLSLTTPGLNDRVEDVPLLVVHLLRSIARSNADVASRIFPNEDLQSEPRVTLGFIDALLRRRYVAHVRELEALLWQALAEGSERILDGPSRTAAVRDSLSSGAPPHSRAPRRQVSIATLQAALVENDWSLERTWRSLGLSSRHALGRLMAKHQLRKSKP